MVCLAASSKVLVGSVLLDLVDTRMQLSLHLPPGCLKLTNQIAYKELVPSRTRLVMEPWIISKICARPAAPAKEEHVKGVPLVGRGFPGQRGVFQRGFESGEVRFTSQNFPLRTLAREMDDEAYHSGNLPSREISEDVSGQSSAGKPCRNKSGVGGALAKSCSPGRAHKNNKVGSKGLAISAY